MAKFMIIPALLQIGISLHKEEELSIFQLYMYFRFLSVYIKQEVYWFMINVRRDI